MASATRSTGILADSAISGLFDAGRLNSEAALDEDQIQPASLDLRLGAASDDPGPFVIGNEHILLLLVVVVRPVCIVKSVTELGERDLQRRLWGLNVAVLGVSKDDEIPVQHARKHLFDMVSVLRADFNRFTFRAARDATRT